MVTYQVKLWSTINEPNFYCRHFTKFDLPGLYKRQPGDDWKCVHHTILAHAQAYRLYQRKYRATQNGKIGGAALALWGRGSSTSWADVEAAERANVFALSAIYHPLVHGDYPDAVRERVNRYSALEGFPESRLPHFTDEEKSLVKGAADFLCFNGYFGSSIADATSDSRPAQGDIASDSDAVDMTPTTPGSFAGLFMKVQHL